MSTTRIEEVILSEEVKTTLDEIAEKYYTYNENLKKVTVNKDNYNKLLKQVMTENGITKYVTNTGIKVSISTTNKPTFDEDALLPFLKELNIPDVVKTKEYIDMVALEDAIYHNQIDPKDLAPYKQDKFITRLTCTKPKTLKEDI